MILDLLYLSFAVHNVDDARRAFKDRLGLLSDRMDGDPFLGSDRGARIGFPNRCWLYIVESQQTNSPVFRYLEAKGPGLERAAFRTDDIEAELARVQRGGVPLDKTDIFDTPSGKRFVVPPQYVTGITVELIQPKEGYWAPATLQHPADVLGLQHIGVATADFEQTRTALSSLLDLPMDDLRFDQHGGQQKDVIFLPGNDRLWLHVVESWEESGRIGAFMAKKGPGLEHIAVEVEDIREGVKLALNGKCSYEDNPFLDYMVYTSRPDGFEAFLRPEITTGLVVELIEPYPFSRGYRERPRR